MASLYEEAATAAIYLDSLAMNLDNWAHQSIVGGWSTHLVEPCRSAANECRRRAANLRAEMNRVEIARIEMAG